MKFYLLKPEVAGGLGPGTVLDRSMDPPVIERLEHRFDGWLGDELLAAIPCFLVTEKLGMRLLRERFLGFELRPVEISKSDEFLDLYGDLSLPEFAWLDVHGEPGQHDLGLSETYRLVVSESCLTVLREFRIDACDVEEWPA
jgi:hypothetical protein